MRALAVLGLLLVMQQMSSAGLIEYVHRDDPSYGWSVKETRTREDGARVLRVALVSQTWKNITWRHRLTLAVPKGAASKTALLLITGSGAVPTDVAEKVARETGCLVAVLNDVPVQPLFGGLTEDALIAHTFVEFMETDDSEWPLLLPMTKSAVRAMDAVQEIGKDRLGLDIRGFVVTGASKRGWTTWLTAAADERVVGIIPMVYDNLDLPSQMRHQLRVWGRFSEEISDYTEKGLPERAASGEGEELVNLVDPFRYRDRITVPKLIMIGTNDRYWPLDALNLYYRYLPGERHILYVPNAGHGLDDHERVVGDVVAFLLYADGRLKLPRFEWGTSGSTDTVGLWMRSDVAPVKVYAWTASSIDRDFRDSGWSREELRGMQGTYLFRMKKPTEGYRAVFGEAVYEIEGRRFFLSTNVHILPPLP